MNAKHLITATQILELCPKAAPIWADHVSQEMTASAILPGNRAEMFLATLAHESGGLLKFEENLNYSAQGLANTWPSRYAQDPRATPKQPNSLALSLHRRPQAIANSAYANRMGNRNEESGDGWLFRGRGPIMITGRKMYALAGAGIGHDLQKFPDDVLSPEVGSKVASWFWAVHKDLNPVADSGNFEAVTRAVNGGLIGFGDRQEWLNKARRILRRGVIT